MPRRHRRGRWQERDSLDEVNPRTGKPFPKGRSALKLKHGRPVGRREIVEKYRALGVLALERDIKGGKQYPGPWHGGSWSAVDLILHRRHFAISIRVWADYYKELYDWRWPSRRRLFYRAFEETVREGLLDLED